MAGGTSGVWPILLLTFVSGCGRALHHTLRISYAWDIAGGAVLVTGETATLTASQLNGLGLGTHTVQLVVTDEFGQSGTAATTLAIYESPSRRPPRPPRQPARSGSPVPASPSVWPPSRCSRR